MEGAGLLWRVPVCYGGCGVLSNDGCVSRRPPEGGVLHGAHRRPDAVRHPEEGRARRQDRQARGEMFYGGLVGEVVAALLQWQTFCVFLCS